MRYFIAGALVIALACGYVAYPHWTLHRLAVALAERDEVTLARLIDWPQVRQGMKEDFKAVLYGAAVAQKDSPLALVGVTLGAHMAEGMIDAMIGPRWLTQMDRRDGTLQEIKAAIGYAEFETPVRFRVDVRLPGVPEAVTILLAFDGVAWKVTRASLPVEALQAAMRTGANRKAD